MEITDRIIAKFVTGNATMGEGIAVIEAAETNLEVANKVIIGFLCVRLIEKTISRMDFVEDTAEKIKKETARNLFNLLNS